jgi:hypothetical protein
MIQLTGTFLDEITHDIPSQNWGKHEWAADFDSMKAVGIDTVIMIRAGYRKRAVFESAVLRQKVPNMLPTYTDLLDIFLTEAERCGMTFFFGTYDAGAFWDEGDYALEAEINKPFCSEVIDKYGHRKAFGGWYICHELSTYNAPMMQVYEDLSKHLRALKDVPILISPYIKGVKQFGADALTLVKHVEEWRQTFHDLQGLVDIVAFQDGNVPLVQLPDYLQANRELASEVGITSWSNIESFDRDMPFNFPPTDIRKLRYKMEQAAKANMEKLITFEFSHFMSPHSMWPSAHQLYARYNEWLKEQQENS